MSKRTSRDVNQEIMVLAEDLSTRRDQWVMLTLAYTRPHTRGGEDVLEQSVLTARIKSISILARDDQEASVVLELDTGLRFPHSKISHLTMAAGDVDRAVVHFRAEVGGLSSESPMVVQLIWL